MVLIQIQIVAMPPLYELKIFAQLGNHVMKMKVTVILMMNVNMVYHVDQTIVQLLWVLDLQLIVVFHVLELVEILVIKVTNIVMMKTTNVDVNGMEETAVVVTLTHNIVQLVNVLIPHLSKKHL